MSEWPKDWLKASPGRRCPSCGAEAGRPILRGLPSQELVGAIERKEIDVVLGGCLVRDDDPTHLCSACGHEFGSRPRRA